jgi:hypothetical protein
MTLQCIYTVYHKSARSAYSCIRYIYIEIHYIYMYTPDTCIGEHQVSRYVIRRGSSSSHNANAHTQLDCRHRRMSCCLPANLVRLASLLP